LKAAILCFTYSGKTHGIPQERRHSPVTITVKEIDASNLKNANQCNEPFMVDSKLVLTAVDGVIRHTVVPVSQYEKRYPPNEVDYTSYIDNPEQCVFFAYSDDDLAGELVLRHWWNNFAYIEDIAVKTTFKGRGIGRALVTRAIEWARKRELPGLMLETQSDNVPACLFYERCGFALGGFDHNLYRALRPESGEIALYWYLLFRGGTSPELN
jgi:ribosomal protein S18 acetylase RimI-like enzyme